jgi:DNA-binding protein YbaB
MEQEKTVDVIPDKVRINVWIARKHYDLLMTLSSMDNRTLSDLVREAFRDYQEKHKERLQGGVPSPK